jgi:hypothetical protein
MIAGPPAIRNTHGKMKMIIGRAQCIAQRRAVLNRLDQRHRQPPERLESAAVAKVLQRGTGIGHDLQLVRGHAEFGGEVTIRRLHFLRHPDDRRSQAEPRLGTNHHHIKRVRQAFQQPRDVALAHLLNDHVRQDQADHPGRGG